MPTSKEQLPHRPLAEIDIGLIGIVRSNGEGGYYDPSDGTAIMIMDGEAVTDEDSEPDPDERGWIALEPYDTHDGYRDMTDFADAVTDPILADRLSRALDGRGAFRRFRDTLAEDGLYPVWARFSDARLDTNTIEWLIAEDLCDPAEGAIGVRDRADSADRALAEIAAWHRG